MVPEAVSVPMRSPNPPMPRAVALPKRLARWFPRAPSRALSAFLLWCLMASPVAPEAARFALVGVDLLRLDEGRLEEDRVVLVRDGWVEGIFPARLAAVPPGYEVHPCRGLTLLPGLVDLSPHAPDPEILSDLARSGVLWTLVTAAAAPETTGLTARGVAVGSILDVSPLLPADWLPSPGVLYLEDRLPLDGQLLRNVPEGAPLVFLGLNVPADLGWRLVRSAERLGYGVVVPGATARAGAAAMVGLGGRALRNLALLALGLDRPSGLVGAGEWTMPAAWETTDLLRAGLESLPPGGADSLALRVSELANLLGQAIRPPVLLPELVVAREALGDTAEVLLDSLMTLIPRLEETGVALAVSSGGGSGRAYLEELRLLLEAGLTPKEVLHAACVEGARILGRPDPSHLEPGQEAVFVLVDGNPLADLEALGRVRGVVVWGEWFPVPPR
jgi:hypothetical protein